MSRKNKNNMNNFNIEGDGNTTSVHAEKITQKQNKQNNIDKSKLGDIHWLGINQFTKRLYYDC